ncbi:MAG: bifunctional [glutamate--ammonia ligase]-adenylyl-L-tyrosine phosphorylase/[glutamate--ammonia-ligase] adenylyltransferase [Mariprofundaceae bacterium]
MRRGGNAVATLPGVPDSPMIQAWCGVGVDEVLNAWSVGLDPAMRARAERLCRGSPLFARLIGLLDRDERAALGRSIEAASLPDATWVPDDDDAMSVEDAQRALRRAKRRGLAHVIWWELGLHGDIARSWAALSDFAEGLIQAALAMAERLLAPRFGRVEGGAFAVIGLGKLGGRELNLGSDVDLLFVYDTPEGAVSSGGRKAVPAKEYYGHLARMLIRLIDEPTAEGRVWPVDMRLRPGGASAAIALGLEATLDFYREHGQTWERAMWLKGRPVAGDAALGARLVEGLRPFIWRRYLDYTTVAALADMKRRIDAQAGDVPVGPGFDVKRGAGGIREIEFVIQSLQLLHGGGCPALRVQGSMPALAALREAGVLDDEDAAALAGAYRFWRRIEHAIQARHGEQTQRLPEDCADWLRALGLLARPLEEMRAQARIVRRVFAQRLLPEPESADSSASGWLEEDAPLPAAFAGGNEARVRQALARIEAHLRRELLPERARTQIERFLDAAMPAWASDANGVRALEAFADLVRAIGGRATWVDLLAHHAGARDWLIGVLAAADWVRERIVRDPSLLEWPLAAERGEADMRAICGAIAAIDPSDEAEALARLGRLVDRGRLLCALAADAHEADAGAIGGWMADLADAATGKALELALRQLDLPRDMPFVALAMGKHGSREMGLVSDLDMVFLLDMARLPATMGEGEARRMVQRLGRRIIRMLSTPAPFGAGFAFDARLRPSGQSGVLVTTLAAFEDYQRQEAQTWEHQALTRARPCAGPEASRRAVADAVRQVLDGRRERAALARDIRAMREKMIAHQASRDAAVIDLKHDPGGLIDLEFLAQFARLAFGVSAAGDPAPTAAMLESPPLVAPEAWHARGATLAGYNRDFRQAELMLRVELGRSADAVPGMGDAPEWETLRRHSPLKTPEQLRRTMRRVHEDFTNLLDMA